MGSLPEVRWATAATALFAAGGICQLAGAAPWLWWGLYLACYAAGGWEPDLPDSTRCASGHWTWTC
jgi:hypothetical protein